MAFRIDTGTVLRKPRRTADGALVVDAILTRTGVFTYLVDGKPFKEYRPADEVFDAESMASFEGVPVTDDHPRVMVDATNVVEYKRGRGPSEVKRDGDNMVGGLIVDDKSLISKMEKGKRDVSNGYTCELDLTPGIAPNGEKYDAIQRKIRGNHIAIVDAGRAGNARVRMDGVGVQICEALDGMVPASDQHADAAVAAKGEVMNLEQALAALHTANEKLGAAKEQLANETKRADAAEQRATKAEGEAKAAQSKADAATDAAKAADERVKTAEAAAAKAKTDAAEASKGEVKARVQFIAKAMQHKVEVKRDGKAVDMFDASDAELQLATIAKLDGGEVPEGKRGDAAYVAARYDLAITRDSASASAFNALNTVVNAPARTDEQPKLTGPAKEAAARKQMNEDSRNAHKTEGK